VIHLPDNKGEVFTAFSPLLASRFSQIELAVAEGEMERETGLEAEVQLGKLSVNWK
jgi:hypothetical protein